MAIVFLSRETILQIHLHQIMTYGGDSQLRDETLLESAVATPMSTFEGVFLYETIPQMAAVYLYHIVMNHPFVDGNKRTGLVAALTFLILNNHDVNTAPHVLEEFVWQLAAGKKNKEDTVRFIQSIAVPKTNK